MADEQTQKKPVPEKKDGDAAPKPVPPSQTPAPKVTTPAENVQITPSATGAAPGAARGTETASNPPAPTAAPNPATAKPSAPPTTPTAGTAAAAPVAAKPAPPPRPKTQTPEITALLNAHPQKVQQLDDTDSTVSIPTILVDKSILIDTLRRLKHEFGFEHLACLTAVDLKDNFEVIYNLWSYSKNRPFEVKVRTPRAEASVPSVTGLWIGANWLEREEWDLMGVRFEGHPDHRRLFMPESWQGHPLRKDYDLKHEQFVGMDAAGEDVAYQHPREGAW